MENQQKIEAPTEADIDTVARALLHAQHMTTEILGTGAPNTFIRSNPDRTALGKFGVEFLI
jgi:hypothetical protein